jgi:cell division protein FtsB
MQQLQQMQQMQQKHQKQQTQQIWLLFLHLLHLLLLLLLLIFLRDTTHQLLLVSFVSDLPDIHNKTVASTIRRQVKRTLSTISK